MQKQTIGIIVSVAGLALLVIGVLLGWVIAPKIIKNKVEEQTRLEEGTDIYNKWVDLPVPISIKFYFFNVTNAREVIEGYKDSSKKVLPILKEIGPFTYLEKRLKYDIRYSDEDDTIFYKQNITYHFDRDTSGADEDQLVTVVNMPLVTVLNLLTVHVPNLARLLLALFLSTEEMFHTVKGGEIAVSGVPSGQYAMIIYLAQHALHLDIPKEFQDGKFGLYLPRNNSNDGEFEVGTGISNSAEFNVIKSVDGKASVDFWSGPYCNMINGTDGTMFPPFIKKSTILRAFGAEICRSIHLSYKEEVKYEGIPGYRFALPAEFYENPYENLDNMCFCTPPPSPLNDTCNMSGAIRIHTCKQGAPIILSKPHFLDADDSILSEIEGLSANPALHESYIDVEPNSGFPLEAYKRVQLSLEIQPMTIFTGQYDQLPHMLFPVAWASEEASLTEELVDEIKTRLVTPLKIVDISKWTLIGIGCFLIVVSAVILIFFRK